LTQPVDVQEIRVTLLNFLDLAPENARSYLEERRTCRASRSRSWRRSSSDGSVFGNVLEEE
jgi:hypothetical protein